MLTDVETPEKKIGFAKKWPILFNLLLIILTACVLVWIALMGIDVWTRHGEYEEVPDLKGLPYSVAAERLANMGLQCELSDSVYDSSVKPGAVVDQSPRAASKVKPKRVVYLTVNAFAPKMVTIPNLIDLSLRQAQSVLQGLDIKNVRVNTVMSEYKDLVIGARFNGLELRAGARIPVSATVTLDVGDGYVATEDSLAVDSVREAEAGYESLDLF